MVTVLNAVLSLTTIPLQETRHFCIQCQEGYFICQATAWNSDWIGGIATPGTSDTLHSYSFIRFISAGADTVVKKLGNEPIIITNYKINNNKYDGSGVTCYEQTYFVLNVAIYSNIVLSSITKSASNVSVKLLNNDTGTQLLSGEGSADINNINNIRVQVDFNGYGSNPAWVNIGRIYII